MQLTNEFFMATAIGALILNLFASYAKDWIDRAWSHHSTRFREKKQAEKAEMERVSEALSKDINLIIDYRILALAKVHRADVLYGAGVMVTVIAGFAEQIGAKLSAVYSFGALGVFLCGFAFMRLSQAMRHCKTASLAKKLYLQKTFPELLDLDPTSRINPTSLTSPRGEEAHSTRRAGRNRR